ncbi:hypothetical protein B296_00031586 [Ensete ventricosum]|uniref:Jacalin-type lectin domain-containing protein n=1 Tax=Ensete ventricosum TaxID=4639 RepID=A0A426ZNP1_ENSVE|nr:hypothetical protein B296_00031586 [Ensete ventricosum]
MLMGPTAVKSLMFHTTKRGYRPYRDELGTFFSSSLVDGMIIGFHGRSGWYIDSVGVHALKEKVPSACGPANDSKRCNDKALSLLDYPSWSGKPVNSTKEIAEEVGIYFTSTTTEGKVVGFHGRSGLYLDAVGVEKKPTTKNPCSPSISSDSYIALTVELTIFT